MSIPTQIHLDPAQADLLRTLTEQSGKTSDQVVQEGLDLLAEARRQEEWRQAVHRVAGMWKDRDDLPDWEALRRQADERLDRLWGISE